MVFFEIILMYLYYVKYFYGFNRYFICKICLEIEYILVMIKKFIFKVCYVVLIF